MCVFPAKHPNYVNREAQGTHASPQKDMDLESEV